MSPGLVALCYGSAIALSLYLLWHFGVQHWYWHLASIALAVAIGFTPMNEFWGSPGMTLLVGWAFLFFFLWGIAAPVFALAARDGTHFHFRHHH
jgi:hypothetical protein